MSEINNFVEKASFYKRKAISSDNIDKLSILFDEGNTFLDNEVLLAEWVEENNSIHKECYIYAEFSFSRLMLTQTYFVIGENLVNILLELKKLTTLYTKDSCKKVFSSYPSVWEVISTNFLGDYSWEIYSNFLHKQTDYFILSKSNYFAEIGLKRSKELSYFVDNLLLELQNLNIDTSILEKKPEPSQANSNLQLPPWIQKALVYGGVFAVKFAARSFGQDVDIQIPDFDIDVDVDVEIDSNVDPNYNFDIATDSSDYIANDGQTGYNISLDHAPNDGSYMKTYQDVNNQDSGGNDISANNGYNVPFGAQKETLTSLGGGQHIDVTIEKEPGTANHFSITSSKGTVRDVDGGDSVVKINGIKFKLPKLKG